MKAILCLALPAAAVIAALVLVRSAGASAFPESALRDYESLLSEGGAGTTDWGSMPRSAGKVITVRPSSWQVYRLGTLLATQIQPGLEGKKEREIDPPRLDDSWFRLDPELRASSPDEVATVILCDYRRIPVGEYWGIESFSGPNAAYKQAVGIKVYDWKTRRFLGECLLAENHEELNKVSVGRYSGDPSAIAELVAKMRAP